MNQQIDEAQLHQDMSQISQITQALTQANILAQTIQEENIKMLQLWQPKSTAVLIQTLSKQFDLLLNQITQTQEQLQALERANRKIEQFGMKYKDIKKKAKNKSAYIM